MLKVGVHAIYGAEAAIQTWTPTFDEYLTDELSTQLNCTFALVPLVNESSVYDAVANSTIDFLYVNSGLHVCLEVSFP